MTLWPKWLDFHRSNAFDIFVTILIMKQQCNLCPVNIPIMMQANVEKQFDQFNKHKRLLLCDLVIWCIGSGTHYCYFV